jgi:hypothetical protein
MSYTQQIHEVDHQNVLAAHKIGLKVPDTEVLTALSLEEAEAITNSRDWEVFGNIGVKRTEGVKITQYAWLDDNYSHHTLAVMNPRLLSGDQGDKLDANIITTWEGKIPVLKNPMVKLRKLIKEVEPEFKGFVGMSVTIKDDVPYYRHVLTRVPYDYFLAFGELMGEDLDHTNSGEMDKLIKEMKPQNKYACSFRVYAYPYERTLNLAMEVPGKQGHDAFIITGSGKNIHLCWEDGFNKVRDIKDICYRIDGSQIARDTMNNLKRKKIWK